MRAITFRTVGQVGSLDNVFTDSDMNVATAWASIQSVYTFTDDDGNLQQVQTASYWYDAVLTPDGKFDYGNLHDTFLRPSPTDGASGSFDFTGDVSMDGNLAADGNATIGGTLSATGNTTLSGTLSVTGTLTVTGAQTLTGVTTFAAIPKFSVANAITAHAGGGQGSAVALTKSINRITTVGTAGDSVKLPAALAGMIVTVINAAAVNSLNCFPASGGVINALAADTALAIAANKTTTFYAGVDGTWDAEVTA